MQPQPLLTGVTIRIVEGGFPHSEIRGSKLIRSSPRLIAAYHVLHRLSAPRHPPNALKALDRSHDRCPPPEGEDKIRKTIFACRIDPIPRHGLVTARALRECSSRIYSLFTMTNSVTHRRSRNDNQQNLNFRAVIGGARRDRTDDLMLAKHALSQLSYGPESSPKDLKSWWAWEDLNLRPHAYQARALTN